MGPQGREDEGMRNVDRRGGRGAERHDRERGIRVELSMESGDIYRILFLYIFPMFYCRHTIII